MYKVEINNKIIKNKLQIFFLEKLCNLITILIIIKKDIKKLISITFH